MPSLTQLLASHGRLLLFDAASQRVQVGLLQPDAPAVWHGTAQEACTGLFAGADIALKTAGLGLSDFDAFVFCEGPGSMLGTRTIAMALRTWLVLKPRPVYAYQSLAIAGQFAWNRNPGKSFSVIADARRDTWHVQSVGTNGRMSPLQRVPAAGLPPGELLTPERFRTWAQPPRPIATTSYDLAGILPTLAEVNFFHAVDAPDAYQHEAPEYKKWSAQIHRAPPAH
ncbi:MAG: peptidase M22 [Lacunisphaera sp.]|nr:peptidase M22 [Lacunisphaera sp.]